MSAQDVEPATEVRRHLLGPNVATLGTLSREPQTLGFPFGSVVPYALDERGRPLILISDLAQHTKNLEGDTRASMLVRAEAAGDPQAHWRITLLGRMERPGEAEVARCHARYAARVPAAPSYQSAHDFAIWRMDVVRVRYIGGFGRIHWVEPEQYLREPGHSGFAEASRGIIEHMNEDHADALVDYCRGLRGFTPSAAELVAVEAAGFFVRTEDPDDLVYFPFGAEIEASGAREAFVTLLKHARDAVPRQESS